MYSYIMCFSLSYIHGMWFYDLNFKFKNTQNTLVHELGSYL